MLPLNSPQRGLKNAKRPFPSKIAFCLKKVCYKVSLCENCQGQSCRVFIGLSKMIGGGRPLLRKNLANTDLAQRRFSIYFRSWCLSSITAGEKSSINTNMKSTTRFPISLRRIVYVDPKPKGGLKQKVWQIWTICDNFKTVRDRMPLTVNH